MPARIQQLLRDISLIGKLRVAKRLALVAVGFIVFVTAFLVVEVPGNTIASNQLQNAGHSLAFAFLTLVVLFGINAQSTNWSYKFKICSLVFLTGLIIELGQSLTGRGFSAVDIIRNLLGVLAGVCFFVALTHVHRRKRYFLLSSVMIAASLATTVAFAVSQSLLPEPPVLVNFEQWGASHRIRSSGTQTTIQDNQAIWPSNNTQSAFVQYQPGRWPSVQFFEVFPDWSMYECLKFGVFNPQTKSIDIRIRVDDTDLGPNQDDHMTVSRTAKPGETAIVIPLDEFREQAVTGNHPGEPLMQRVYAFMFYVSRVEGSLSLVFDDVRLGC